jgi:ribonuclease HII
MVRKFQLLAKDDPCTLEKTIRKNGLSCFAGVDEAGRGPLAGPVVACACILPKNCLIPVGDSKTLSREVREKLYQELISSPKVKYSISVVSHTIIDRINILQATMRAMKSAVLGLKKKPDVVIIDGNKAPLLRTPCVTVIKGDFFCPSISAASIIAKVVRDHIMDELDKKYPEWGFSIHKGYGTKLHHERIEKHGLSPIHRKTFGLAKALLEESQQLNLFDSLENISE